MYPGAHAHNMPDKAAAIHASTGDVLTYCDLNNRSIQLARLWRDHGLQPGDHVDLLMENNLRFFEVVWAVLRSGLYMTAINWHLPPDDAAYIINDYGARAMVSSWAMQAVAGTLPGLILNCSLRLMTDGCTNGWTPYEPAIAEHPITPLAQEPLGDSMLYGSGTTGRPKGIKRPLAGLTVAEGSRSSGRLRGFGLSKALSSGALSSSASALRCPRQEDQLWPRRERRTPPSITNVCRTPCRPKRSQGSRS